MYVFFSGIYTIIILGAAQLAANKQKGKTIIVNAKTFYKNIGQKFTDDKYFYSRPSAVSYSAAGSKKANANPEYSAMFKDRIDSFMVRNSEVNKTDIQSEMVTASGSGFDPYILLWDTKIKIKRTAKNRNIFEANLQELATANTEGTFWVYLGRKN